MRGKTLCTVVLGIAVSAFARFGATAEEIALESLLDEMTDLSLLAEFPDPPFTCRQFSSYDRRSKTAADHAGWFANHDRGQHLRIERRDGRKEFVMMDAEGPGCIVRIWSANANDGGDLRIYLDGSAEPALEMRMQDATDGKHSPFPAPLAGVHSRGWNLYFPFPYAKRCKVTVTGGDIYYQINYRTYPKGTKVRSFTMDQIAALKPKIDRVRRLLERPYVSNYPPADASVKSMSLTQIEPGSKQVVADLTGPGAVFELQLAANPGDMFQILRSTVLEIAFDGREPSVRCPAGDFFGASPGINPYESLPLQIHESGELRSKWFMPYAKNCRITLSNRGPKSVGFRGSVTTVPYEWNDRSMHFHAKWRAENRMATRPFKDWTFVHCEGKGVFNGCMLSVANPVKQWWGEGDEKIYVDGETFPSHFGTGTEDYFGYAWCCPDVFVHAYHNQPRCDGPGNYGLTSVNRFHILDQIPFTERFKFDLEVWHWNQKTKVSYNATSYWYMRPGGADFFQPLDDEMLEVVVPEPWPAPKRVEGAIEGESLRIVRKSAGNPHVQEGFEDIWSGGKQIWWIDAKPGDTLILALPSPAAGAYKLHGNFTKAIDYGVIQLYVNDRKAGEPMDFFNDGVIATGKTLLGTFDLKKGDNILKAEIVGKNAKAVPKYMFGIDYLMLEK